jgi:hypothetical protein
VKSVRSFRNTSKQCRKPPSGFSIISCSLFWLLLTLSGGLAIAGPKPLTLPNTVNNVQVSGSIQIPTPPPPSPASAATPMLHYYTPVFFVASLGKIPLPRRDSRLSSQIVSRRTLLYTLNQRPSIFCQRRPVGRSWTLQTSVLQILTPFLALLFL